MGYAHQHHNLGPSIQEYFKNQFVMAFNLCGDGCVGGHDHVSEYGSFSTGPFPCFLKEITLKHS